MSTVNFFFLKQFLEGIPVSSGTYTCKNFFPGPHEDTL